MTRRTPKRRLTDALGDRHRGPADDELIAVYVEALHLYERLEAMSLERFNASLAAQMTASMRVRVRCLQLLGLTHESEETDDEPNDFDDF